MEDKLIFDLINDCLFNKRLPTYDKEQIDEQVLLRLYKLSKIHDLAHVVCYALIKNGLIEKGTQIYNAFLREQQLAVIRYEQTNHELKFICDVLEKEGIKFIPLKGSVLRDYYKEPWLRTSCDIDVLIKHDDLEKTTKLLTEKYQCSLTGRTEHDVSFMTVGNVHLELHFKLVEGNKSEKVLETVWERVKLKEGKNYHYLMNSEMYYFYHVAHMAKHFEDGGCGIRTFLDLYLMLENMPVDKLELDKLLGDGGLKAFCDASKNLALSWFGGEEKTELSRRMEDYILGAGVYGNVQNRVAVHEGEKGGKFRYIFRRIFLPYSQLKILYPKIEKHKILTPFCGIHRWFKILFGGRAKRAVNELKISANMDKEQLNSTRKLISELGLR